MPVITGVGVVSSAGIGMESFWSSLREGRSGIRVIEALEQYAVRRCYAGEVAALDLRHYVQRRGLQYISRSARFACAASALALRDAGLPEVFHESDRIGVVLGTAYGSVQSMLNFEEEAWREGPRFVNPLLFPNTVINAPAGYVGVLFGLSGPNVTLSTNHASGLDALSYGAELLDSKQVDVVLAGGYDELCGQVITDLALQGKLSLPGDNEQTISSPFTADRSGTVMGEGAGVFVLERMQDAISRRNDVQVGLLGWASRTSKKVDHGEGALLRAEVMCEAIARAGLDRKDVACVFASANGETDLDCSEAIAIHDCFNSIGEQPPVVALKALFGECGGASGPLLVAGAVKSLQEGFVPGIHGCLPASEVSLPIKLLGSPLTLEANKAVLINSFQISGPNTSVVIGRTDAG